MTTNQIQTLFFATIEEKAVYNKLEGISEDKVYNWRKGRGNKPSIGDMIHVLYQLKLVSIVLNNEFKGMKEEWPVSPGFNLK